MSGIELIGLAASVIQIAELGGKLSVQLYTFTRKVKNANKSIDALSQDIAATGAVLKQLADVLSRDKDTKLCSQEAIDTAKGLVEDTKKVFTSLTNIIDYNEQPGTKSISFKQKLKFPFLEPKIAEVQANLERLKSSLLVILNVLIFAGQLRSNAALPILEDQRDLLNVLAAEKIDNEKRYNHLLKAIEDSRSPTTFQPTSTSAVPNGKQWAKALFDFKGISDNELSIRTGDVLEMSDSPRGGWQLCTNSSGMVGWVPSSYLQEIRSSELTPSPEAISTSSKDVNVSGVLLLDPASTQGAGNTKPPAYHEATSLSNSTPNASDYFQHYRERIKCHSELIQDLVSRSDSRVFKVDPKLRGRVQDTLLDVHWEEWKQFRESDRQVIMRLLSTYEDVSRYWIDKIFTEFVQTTNESRLTAPDSIAPSRLEMIQGTSSDPGQESLLQELLEDDRYISSAPPMSLTTSSPRVKLSAPEQAPLSAEEIAEFTEIFEMFDTDGDGYLTAEDLESAMRGLGEKPADNEIADLLQEFDHDGSGRLSRMDFISMMSVKTKSADFGDVDEGYEAFKVFDRDGNGKITIEEAKQVLSTLGEELSIEEIDDMMREFDNGSGSIDYEEFRTLVMGDPFPRKAQLDSPVSLGTAKTKPAKKENLDQSRRLESESVLRADEKVAIEPRRAPPRPQNDAPPPYALTEPYASASSAPRSTLTDIDSLVLQFTTVGMDELRRSQGGAGIPAYIEGL